MNQFPTYSVAIRTLGQSGEKFRRTIESLLSQTVRPSGIYVYIAEGYALPGRVADEVYITCPKGMVAQRALPFTEIETELVLLSDDDIEFASDSVERLMSGLLEMGGDCISANVFPNHKWNFKQKFVQAAFHGILPSLFGKYAFRIRKDASYSYALFPKRIMRSQSCAGAALLINKTVLSNLHYSEECWMDHFQYALGDDQLFGYKLHCLHYRLLVHYDTGVLHLDAATGQVKDPVKADFNHRMLKYIIWHRSIFEPSNSLGKVCALSSFYSVWCVTVLWSALKALRDKGQKLHNVIHSLQKAKAFVQSTQYQQIPKWPVR